MELISCDVIKTDVSCIKIFQNIIFIGNGNYLYLCTRTINSIKKRIYIFDERIFGIDIDETKNQMLVYGGKYLKTYKFDLLHLDFNQIAFHKHSDWILIAKFINNGDYIAGVTMHNVAILWNFSFEMIEDKVCAERCISYCAHIVNDNWSDLIVLSGTVFSQILLWWPAKSLASRLCSVLCRLIGHKGVIFSIDYHPKSNIICTTSDDRTAKIWFIENETLSKELSQNSINIHVKYTLIGHTARVFRCKVLHDYIITAGEDGVVNIWNSFGELIRKMDVHQGGSVWSLDCCEETNEIVSGGGDSGVILFKLHTTISKTQVEKFHNEWKNPKKILILSSNSLIYLTDDGTLIHYNINDQICNRICTHEDLKSYGLLEKSPCGSILALAGYHGTIHLYKNLSNCLEYMFSCKIKTKERIFSLHWLSCKALLTCGPNGILTMWIVRENNIYPMHFWQLPPSKEPWSTAACLCGNKNVLVGDRRSTMHLYSFQSNHPVQIIKKAHNYLGITNLYFHDGRIISLGRSSTINEYKFDYKEERIIQVHSHKVPFTWLASLYRNNCDNSTLLLGFSGINFVIYDHVARRILLQSDCGGGHRSWDFCVTNGQLTFSYIKDKLINLIDCNLADLQGVNLIKGYHLNEINAFKIIRVDDKSLECFFVSGGEDTVIRFCSKNFKNTLGEFQNLNVLKSHLSSIRTIAVFRISDFVWGNKYLIFSGGGRSQIILWELSFTYEGNKTVTSCCEKFNHHEVLHNKDDLETRVMALGTVMVNNVLYLLGGYSDGNVKIFQVNLKDNERRELLYFNHIPLYKSRCILQISVLAIGGFYVLVSMATDGFIVFSNITDIFYNKSSPELAIASIKAHQSGINSFSYWLRDDVNFIFLTGGDDAAIALNAFEIKSEKTLVINHLAHYSDESFHGAQVTGAYIIEKYFLTASIDQKVLLFKWNFLENIFNVECMQEYNCAIWDIQGMECKLVNDSLKIFVFGRGYEILTVRL